MAGRVYDSFGPKSPLIAGSVILLFMIYLMQRVKIIILLRIKNQKYFNEKPG